MQTYRRDTNVMPQWAGSCWYYLRYLDPENDDALVDAGVERYWMDGVRADGSPAAGGVDLRRHREFGLGTAELRRQLMRRVPHVARWHQHVSQPDPLRLDSASTALVGTRLSESEATDALADDIANLDIMIDHHASPAYRRRVAATLVGSYPTVSPLPSTSPEITSKAVSFLFHFPLAFAT